MKRILVILLLLGAVALLVVMMLFTPSCASGSGEPVPPPPPRDAGPGPEVPATVEWQVRQTLDARKRAEATQVAAQVAEITGQTPSPSATPHEPGSFRVPVFRRTPRPAGGAAPSSTATPAPTPALSPAFWPTLPPILLDDSTVPAPTASPPPPPTPVPGDPPFGELLSYQHDWRGYRILHPAGWEFGSGGERVEWRSGSGAWMRVRREPVDSGWSLDVYMRDYLRRLDALARLWPEYPEEARFEVGSVGDYETRRLEYVRRDRGGACLERVVEHLLLSRHHPEREIGYVISAGVCVEQWDSYAGGLEDVLGSFAED